MKPLEKFLQPYDIESIFINIKVKREIIWTDTQTSGVNIRSFQCYTWLWVFCRSWLKLITCCWKMFETPFHISEPRIFTRCSLTTRKGMQQQLTHTTVCLNWSEQQIHFPVGSPCRLLLYGHYCSQVEAASKHLDKVSNAREDVRMKLEVRTSHTVTNSFHKTGNRESCPFFLFNCAG